MRKKLKKRAGDLGQAIRNRVAPLGGVELPIPPREPIPSSDNAEALYREAALDSDRRETAADWDDLPTDEALD